MHTNTNANKHTQTEMAKVRFPIAQIVAHEQTNTDYLLLTVI